MNKDTQPQAKPIPILKPSQKSAPVPSPNLTSQPKPAPKTQPSSSSKNGYWYIIGYLVLVGLIFYYITEKGDLHWGIALILAFLLGGIMFIWIGAYPLAIIYIIYKIIKES